jgi:transposase
MAIVHALDNLAPQIPGICPLVATAIVASIGNGAAFHKGREFAGWGASVSRPFDRNVNPLAFELLK